MEKKRNALLVVLGVILAVGIIGGTVAWLTRTSSLTNTFTVGSFETPVTDPTDSSKSIDIEGNLYEPSWDEDAEHKLLPGNEYAKDPYVGIGAGSEDGVVYVYVKNNFSNKIYFEINNGWSAVSGYATAGSKAGTYTGGLFKYDTVLTAKSNGDTWTTTPLFSKVEVADTANSADFNTESNAKTITVSSFLHQAKDDEGEDIDATEILNAAKGAFKLS